MALKALNPRESFLADDLAVKKFRSFIDDPTIQTGIQAVMIEFMQTNPTAEACEGANYIIERLCRFTDSPPKRKAWPNHAAGIWAEKEPEKKKT